jgi:aryl-alcohol dehydrogenase-like predicted oxidoreductase
MNTDLLIQRLVLGTAQLGMQYGIANVDGTPSEGAALEIIKAAYDSGIRYFDTAIGYGEAQERLGRILRGLNIQTKVKIITKFGDIFKDPPRSQLLTMRQQLGVENIWGILLHREEDLERIADSFNSMDIYNRFGVSLYSPDVAMQALSSPHISLLQVPGNVFDKRFLSPEFLGSVQSSKVTLMVRSIFLQGLALMSPETVPPRIPGAKEAVALLDEFCQRNRMDRKTFCLHYIAWKTTSVESLILFGCDTANQVRQVSDLARKPKPDEKHFKHWENLWRDCNSSFVDPRNWPHPH